MKKILFLVLAMAVAFSCQKKEIETPNADVEVVFGIQKVDPNDGLKATDPPTCPTDPVTGELLEPAYAEIYINDGVSTTMYSPTVFDAGRKTLHPGHQITGRKRYSRYLYG